MSIETDPLAFARQWDSGARRVGQNVIALCPAHDDHNRSLHLRLKNGKLVFICRAGCTQAEVIARFRAMGIWPPEGQPRKAPVPTHIKWQFCTPKAPPCCLERIPGTGRDCLHWAEFRVQRLVAHLRGNIEQAIAELRAKAPAMYGHELTPDELRSEIIFAGREFGSIWPREIPEAQAIEIIDMVLADRERNQPARTSMSGSEASRAPVAHGSNHDE